MIITAKELTATDHERLNGSVEKILTKSALSRDDLLREVRELVGRSVRQRHLSR